MKDTEYIKEFWQQKEKETGSKLVIPSYADLFSGWEGIALPAPGLLYLMENGFYFENFENNNFMSNLLTKKETFKKINIHIAAESILRVYDFSLSLKEKSKSIIAKIKDFLSPPPYILVIEYLNEKDEKTIVKFKTFIKPSEICEAYNKLH